MDGSTLRSKLVDALCVLLLAGPLCAPAVANAQGGATQGLDSPAAHETVGHTELGAANSDSSTDSQPPADAEAIESPASLEEGREPDPAEGQPIDITLDYRLFTRSEIRRGYGVIAGTEGEDLVRFRTQFGLTVSNDFENDWYAGVRVLARAGGFWEIGGNTLQDPNLDLHEGYAFIGNDWMEIQAGRFELNYGDQLVIGPVGFHHVGRAFDGGRASVKLNEEGAFLDVFGAALNEGALDGLTYDDRPPFKAGDFYLFGAYAGLEGLTPIPGQWDIYVFPRLGSGEGVDVTVGTRLKGCAESFCWRGEGGVQAGTRPTSGTTVSSAWQLDAELGVRTDGILQRAMVGGLYASGDDPETSADEGWDQLYPTGHKWMGHMDLFARTNIAGPQASVSLGIADTIDANAKVFSFFQLEQPVGVESGPRYIGTEMDVSISWQALPS
jgi:hypothetical protein